MSTRFAFVEAAKGDRLMRKLSVCVIVFAGTLALAVSTTSGNAGAVQSQARDGRAIFRFDTFGDEQLWTDVLRLNEALQSVAPKTALSVGLKVDVDALPA